MTVYHCHWQMLAMQHAGKGGDMVCSCSFAMVTVFSATDTWCAKLT